jgi:hypothetical protein
MRILHSYEGRGLVGNEILSRRCEQRKKIHGGVLFSFYSDSQPDTHSALLSNISMSGACIYTQSSLPRGESISIYSRVLEHREPREAKVMWCSRITDDLYMAGLLFCSDL